MPPNGRTGGGGMLIHATVNKLELRPERVVTAVSMATFSESSFSQ